MDERVTEHPYSMRNGWKLEVLLQEDNRCPAGMMNRRRTNAHEMSDIDTIYEVLKSPIHQYRMTRAILPESKDDAAAEWMMLDS